MGKTHPSTLMTIENMANAYTNAKDFTKVEDMYRLALDGYEKSLGKGHQRTKDCAFNMHLLFEQTGQHREKAELESVYPKYEF